MRITLNGAEKELHPATSVAELLGQLDLLGKRLAVERNGEIVPKSLHAATPLTEGDRLEIVVAVGGG
ncbi:MAG: sulfur carrier protein ThiS [Burkholderiaceae bacterium]|nr:MAG: sulfur carrier protein ThiS [Burkholderiaceae bacterium]